jgi:uncharacterized protein YhbP (UPF0306 family)
LIETQRTLVLATVDPDPWAAPVYYVYRKRRFYFFSATDSRHVTAALAAGRCAGAIFRDSDDWRDIEGLQMNGTLHRIRMGAEAIGAFTVYLEKFPTVKGFFRDAAVDLDLFTKRFHAHLYVFVPERVLYVNNRTGLGERREIELPA